MMNDFPNTRKRFYSLSTKVSHAADIFETLNTLNIQVLHSLTFTNYFQYLKKWATISTHSVCFFSTKCINDLWGWKKRFFSTQCKDELWGRKNAFFDSMQGWTLVTEKRFFSTQCIDELWDKKRFLSTDWWVLGQKKRYYYGEVASEKLLKTQPFFASIFVHCFSEILCGIPAY